MRCACAPIDRVAYIGKVHHKNELYDGEQPAIVAADIWQQVQAQLREQRGSGAGRRGISSVPCSRGCFTLPCGRAMTPTHAIRGRKCYRYYLCCGAHRHGRQSCPSKAIPAEPIERLVLEQIQSLSPRPTLGNMEGQALTLVEDLRLVRLLIERVEYDGAQSKVTINFRPESHPSQAAEAGGPNQEINA